MKSDYSERARKSLQDLPSDVRRALFKQVKLLELNLRRPSLRAKKFDETQNLWQARVNRGWRFYFLIRNDTCYIVDIIPHPKSARNGMVKRKSASSRQEKRISASALFTTRVGDAERRDLERIAGMRDLQIDFSDAPEGHPGPSEIHAGRFYRPIDPPGR